MSYSRHVIYQSYRSDNEKTLEGVFSSWDSTLSAAPAVQPVAVQTALKSHQLQALGWMLDKEMSARHRLPPFWHERHVFDSVPWSSATASRWGARHFSMARTFLMVLARFARGKNWFFRFPKQLTSRILSMVPVSTSYYHSLTNIETQHRPTAAAGGILAGGKKFLFPQKLHAPF